MALSIVLAVGMDLSKLAGQRSDWKSQGFTVITAGTINEAIDHFRGGNFHLVLLGASISKESCERLTYLIRASGSPAPVVCLARSSGEHHAFADATLGNDSNELITGMKELLKKNRIVRAAR
jgi:DNA-binding response OmpR family regulator